MSIIAIDIGGTFTGVASLDPKTGNYLSFTRSIHAISNT